jgi:hypothetical protein
MCASYSCEYVSIPLPVVMPYGLEVETNISEKCPEDGDGMFLRNAGICL